MGSEGEKIAVLETKVQNMEQTIKELNDRLRSLEKWQQATVGALALLQILGTLWLKFGNSLTVH